jgi:hypothetical protein
LLPSILLLELLLPWLKLHRLLKNVATAPKKLLVLWLLFPRLLLFWRPRVWLLLPWLLPAAAVPADAAPMAVTPYLLHIVADAPCMSMAVTSWLLLPSCWLSGCCFHGCFNTMAAPPMAVANLTSPLWLPLLLLFP